MVHVSALPWMRILSFGASMSFVATMSFMAIVSYTATVSYTAFRFVMAGVAFLAGRLSTFVHTLFVSLMRVVHFMFVVVSLLLIIVWSIHQSLL
jgi:hypothetical protein